VLLIFIHQRAAGQERRRQSSLPWCRHCVNNLCVYSFGRREIRAVEMSTTFTFEHVNRLKTTHLQRDTRSVNGCYALSFSLCGPLCEVNDVDRRRLRWAYVSVTFMKHPSAVCSFTLRRTTVTTANHTHCHVSEIFCSLVGAVWTLKFAIQRFLSSK